VGSEAGDSQKRTQNCCGVCKKRICNLDYEKILNNGLSDIKETDIFLLTIPFRINAIREKRKKEDYP
jgi:hypothetical protein